jgi:hypothetical protein
LVFLFSSMPSMVLQYSQLGSPFFPLRLPLLIFPSSLSFYRVPFSVACCSCVSRCF